MSLNRKHDIHIPPDAKDVEVDNSDIPCLSEDAVNVYEAIKELCQIQALSNSPGIAFGRDGNTSGSTINPGFLLNNQVFSNKTGVPFGLNDGALKEIWIGVQDPTDVTIRFYYHDGNEINLTSLATVNLVVADGRNKTFDVGDLGVINIPKDKQLAAAVIGGNGKNIKAFVIVSGIRGT